MSLFKNKNYLLLRTGWTISNLGSQLQSFAFSFYVLTVTRSALQYSLTLCMEFLPMLLFAPFGGYLADRFDRKKQIILFDLLSALVVFLLILIYLAQGHLRIFEIYLCVFILSTCQTFFNPAASCLMQSAVKPEDYTRQKSVDSTISSAITLFAPAAAGVLYSFLGIGVVLLINVVSFLVSALLEFFLKLESYKAEKQDGAAASFFRSLGEGIRHIRKSRFIVSFLFVLSLLNFILPSIEIGLMTVSQKLMHLSSTLIGLEISALSVGMLCGALVCAVFAKRFQKFSINRIVVFSIFVDCAVFFLIGAWLKFFYAQLPLLPNVLIFIVLNFILTFGNTILSVNLNAQFQKQVPNALMGRISALVSAILSACVPLGQITAGLLMSGLPYAYAYLIEGVLCVLLLGYSFNNARKSAIIEKEAA
jgi:MFS family permease